LFELGRQVDRNEGENTDEYRYWDDMVISTEYIGLTGGSGAGDTVAPEKVEVRLK
jgi:hypothetical protein